MCNNPECVKLRQDLKDAWERILKMDQELKLINEQLTLIEAQTGASQTRSVCWIQHAPEA